MSSRKMMSFCTSWVPSPREEAQASMGYLWIGCSSITEAAPNRSAARQEKGRFSLDRRVLHTHNDEYATLWHFKTSLNLSQGR